ncbi:MAG: DEAD/DEAH box helicase family protein [Deltaproteobacteria bacterium]|nr:DEAD/DEAH box helicase family protein [Deltaproteobacteria bacterium]
MELTDYQREALASIHRHLETERSTLAVMPTGTGKTVLFSAWAHSRREIGPALVVAHRRELIEQATDRLRRFGLEVEIEMADQRSRPHSMHPADVVVASVQSMSAKRMRKFGPDYFASIVVDEAHHSTASSYRRILDYFAGAKVLAVTATPNRADGVGLHNICESVAYEYSLAEAIRAGYLVRPRCSRSTSTTSI